MATSTIVERSRTARAKIEKLAELGTHQDLAQAMETRADQFVAHAERLRPLWRVAKGLIKREYHIERQAANAKSLNMQLGQILVVAEETPEMLADPATLRDVGGFVGRLVDSLQRSCAQAWAEYRRSRDMRVDDAVLSVLGELPAFSHQVSRIRGLRSRLMEWRDLPKSGEDLDAFDALADALQATWTSISGEGIPDEVMQFLREAGSGDGARLERVTPAVMDWLRDNGIEGSFHVVVK